MSLRRLLPTLDNAGRRLVLAEVLGQPVSMKRARRRPHSKKSPEMDESTPRRLDLKRNSAPESVHKDEIDTGYSFILGVPPQSSLPKESTQTEYSFVLNEKSPVEEVQVEETPDQPTTPEVQKEVAPDDPSIDLSDHSPPHPQGVQVMTADPALKSPSETQDLSDTQQNQEGIDDE